VYISGLSLTNYKNYIQHVYELHPKLNLIVGLNGVGKTNLLDAVYYSCIGKSYSTTSDRYNIRKGEDFLRLEGVFYNNTKAEKYCTQTIRRTKKL